MNIVDRGRVNLTAVYVITPRPHTSDYVGVGVVHVNLDKPRWCIAALMTGDDKWNVRRPPVVFIAYRRLRLRVVYGCARESGASSRIERRRQRLERFDRDDWDGPVTSSLTSSPPPSATPSSYAHPFGRVGRRKRSGIFVVFPDNGGVVFHLDMVLEDCVDEVPSQGLGLATSIFRCDHASG